MRERVQRNIDVESKKVNPRTVLKQVRYFCMSMIALVLSLIFPIAEKQLLMLSLITGAKWIVDGIDKRISILIRCNKSSPEGGD